MKKDISDAERSPRYSNYLDAKSMLVAVRNDPQMTIPAKPVLTPGLKITQLKHALVIDGGSSRKVLEGKDATQLVPKILPLLDGTHTVPELARKLSLDVDKIEAVIALLKASGFIIASNNLPDTVPVDASYAVARHLDTTRRWSSVIDAFESVQRQALCLIGDYEFVTPLQKILLTDGIPVNVAGDFNDVGENAMCIVVLGGKTELTSVKVLFERGISVILVGINGTQLWYTAPIDSTMLCFDCVYRLLSSVVTLKTEGPMAEYEDFNIALAALHIFNVVVGIGNTVMENGLVTIDLKSGSFEYRIFYRMPQCVNCGMPSGVVGGFPYFYETVTSFVSKAKTSLKGHQNHYNPNNLALQWKRINYSVAPRFSGNNCNDSSELKVKGIFDILKFSFGMDPSEGKTVRRISPSGGNMGSPQAYVVIPTSAGRIEPGIYFYDPFDHSLVLLLSIDFDIFNHITNGKSKSALLVTVGDIRKIEAKYNSLALRICLLDAGVTAAQIMWNARKIGIHVSRILEWDDRLVGALLQLDLDEYPIMGIFMLENFFER